MILLSFFAHVLNRDFSGKRVNQPEPETSPFSSVNLKQGPNSAMESETILQPLKNTSGYTLDTSNSSSKAVNSGEQDVPESACEMSDSCSEVEGSSGQVNFTVKLNGPDSGFEVQDQSPGRPGSGHQ